SYGTHLLWPFSDERIAWHIISIIDPVFTLVLLLTVIFTLRRRAPLLARSGLAVAGLYLLLGVVQLQRAESVAHELAAARGHKVEQLVVKPTLGNLLLWRSIYQAQGIYYIDAVRVGLGNRRSYPGESIPRFDITQLAVVPAPDSVLAQDLQRFAAFSDGYIALHPQRQDVLGDVRYAMLPTSARPLWGIEFDVRQPQAHARYRFYRDMTEAERDRFKAMLLGQ
ncbi:MAG: metal-dependent hydrolase, partial [Gammaproteobacteria bacterium]